MMTAQLIVVLLGWAIAGGSPGPATLAISGTSLDAGRRAGLLVAFGVLVGSASWGAAAALGMSAVMLANAWVVEAIRYIGAAYLLYLAIKTLRRGLSAKQVQGSGIPVDNSRLFMRGFLIHITNPKAIFSWGAIYSIALPPTATSSEIWMLFAILLCVSAIVFLGYAVLFSNGKIAAGYRRAQRWFDLGFAALFGAASIKILTAKLPT